MDEKKTFDDLQVGDEVLMAEWTPWRPTINKIVTITRVTAKQVLVGGTRFRKSDGNRVGIHDSCIKILTPERRQECELQRKRLQLHNRVASLYNSMLHDNKINYDNVAQWEELIGQLENLCK